MLLAGEQVIFIASQSKVALGGSLSPKSIYITNMRVSYKDSRWLGLADILNVSYRDVSTVMLKHGVFTTELYFKPRSATYKIKIPPLEKWPTQSQPAHPDGKKGRAAEPEPRCGAGVVCSNGSSRAACREKAVSAYQRGFVPLLQLWHAVDVQVLPRIRQGRTGRNQHL